MKLEKEQIYQIVDKAFRQNKTITVLTYYLSNYGEMLLNTIGERLLELLNKKELGDIMYTAVKELVMNAAKANLKRVLIEEHNLDPENESDHEKLMELFKTNIRESQIRKYRHKFKARQMPITVNITYEKDKMICIKVKNAFCMLPHEEKRVREKFRQSQKYNDLMEYYIEHGDETEGAGMGITLVEILLGQSGFDRHLFTIHSDERDAQTIAKVEIPLSDKHVPQRLRFKQEMLKNGLPAEQLRQSGQFVAMA